MKFKYLVALAAASLFGMTALTACGEPETDVDAGPDATEEVDNDATDADLVEDDAEEETPAEEAEEAE